MTEADEWTFSQPDFCEVRGAELETSKEDELPDDMTDERLSDPGENGKPGPTIKMTGIVNRDISLVQRRTSSRTTAINPDENLYLDGFLNFTSEINFTGSDPANLLTFIPKRYPDDNPENSYFLTTRLDPTSFQGDDPREFITKERGNLFNRTG